MLLKTLSLAGFKSFADRTRLTFDAGINVVVGPNGSGKSNLLDALAWVMGTQATSALRTQRMDDVIFAGTTSRPALGRAEVSLTLDNSDEFLPIDLAEITLTRRLYRDGTSEYELNRTPCRLLDIQDILSDGGVGRHQHVLVSQGQIGEILSASPEQHRAVIEEAAGITKHRSRRRRSVRRLEQTAIDISRLHDILDQERRRLRPLKRQANAAERYDDVKARILELRLWLGGDQLRGIRSRVAAAAAERSELDKIVVSAEAELVSLGEEYEVQRAAASDVGRALDGDTTAAARLETLLERLQRIAMVSRERRLALESRLRGADEQQTDLETELVHLAQELVGLASDVEKAESVAERKETVLQALEDEERALGEQIQLPAEGLLANVRGELRALETAESRDEREREQATHRLEIVLARHREEVKSGEDHVEAIRSADARTASAQDSYDGVRDARERVQAEWDEAAAHRNDRHLELVEALARHDAIDAALAGVGDPSARERTASSEGVRGTIASRLDVPQELTEAVDAALGTWSRAYVTTGAAATATVATALKTEGLGSVSLVSTPETTKAAAASLGLTREMARERGLDALVDLLGASADAALAHVLLGDVVLVEGWSAGWDLVRRHPAIRAVTPEGDLITAERIRLGTPGGAGPAALEVAAVTVETAERELARADSRLTSTRREFDAVRDSERRALEDLEQLEARLAGHTEALALNERARGESTAELARLDGRLEALQAAGETRRERIAELRPLIEELDGEARSRQDAWDALNRRRDEVARRRDAARREREEAAGSLAGAGERHRLLEQRHAAVLTELAELDSEPVDPLHVVRLAGVESTARDALGVVRKHIEALRERQRGLRERADDADRRLAASQHRRRDLELTLAASKDRSSSLAIELAELRVRGESVAEMLRRDADATEEEALAAPAPELDSGTDPRELLQDLDARRRRMGPVNPLAAVEYRELAAHVEELESQLSDLDASRAELKTVITALDEEMTVMFLDAFSEISRLYEENFGLVFPGGRGRLRLVDADRPLEAGVEIEAQPLGKKVGRLSLLSGGERALAALAFLFAVFRARPSPFYVLDEVEAALDDANLQRFLRLADTLRGVAQLVIITHQQQTMESADILYGVTMEPGESSEVISKRLDRLPA